MDLAVPYAISGHHGTRSVPCMCTHRDATSDAVTQCSYHPVQSVVANLFEGLSIGHIIASPFLTCYMVSLLGTLCLAHSTA